MTALEFGPVGYARAGSASFEAALAKVPPQYHARLRAYVDGPAAREAANVEAAARVVMAAQHEQVARAPAEAANAVAYAHEKAAGRKALNDRLRMALGKSHGILRDLQARKRRDE
jgi:hypothetical protein